VAELKRAYLFTGDDDVKIDQARRRLAERAAADGATLEALSGDACTPENFAAALLSPTLLPGTRFVLADGSDTWKAADVGPAADAVAALADEGIDAIAVLINRKKPLKAISDAVAAVGGETREFKQPSEKELPKWLVAQAEALGVTFEPAAAVEMIAIVGKPAKRASASQQWSPKRRLLSELEKLATDVGKGGSIGRDLVREAVSGDATAEVFDLTDAALDQRHGAAIRNTVELLDRGEAPPMIVAMLARSFGQVQSVAALSEAGRSTDELGIQAWLAGKLKRQAQERGSWALKESLIEIARLDSAVKGGSALDNETELVSSISKISGQS
jgi:DNA polymerase III delta subunit